MYEAEVKKGAEWLDKNVPGWVDKIDMKKFYVGAYETCALGQSIGGVASQNLCEGTFGIEHGFRITCKNTVMEPRFSIFRGIRDVPVQREMTRDEQTHHYRLLSQTWMMEIFRRRTSQAELPVKA